MTVLFVFDFLFLIIQLLCALILLLTIVLFAVISIHNEATYTAQAQTITAHSVAMAYTHIESNKLYFEVHTPYILTFNSQQKYTMQY